MGKNRNRNNRNNHKAGGNANTTATNDNVTDLPDPSTPKKEEVTEIPTTMEKVPDRGEVILETKEDVPTKTSEVPVTVTPSKAPVNLNAPKTPTVHYETVYPENNEQELDKDCLVPFKSPLHKGENEPSVAFGEIYQEAASPMIPTKDDQSNGDSVSTEVEKVEERLGRVKSIETDESIQHTWRDVEESEEGEGGEKDEDISVLTENILTPERQHPEPKTNTRGSSSSPLMKESNKSGLIVESTASIDANSNQDSYRDIFEDYLETISDNLIAFMAFVQPNTKHEHYEDYLKAKVSYLLWPLTFVLPNIAVEMIRFLLVTYLLLVGSGLILFWYAVKFGVWISFAPWRMFQRSVEWIFQFLVHLSVNFVNTAQGGNQIPKALNGHVMKH